MKKQLLTILAIISFSTLVSAQNNHLGYNPTSLNFGDIVVGDENVGELNVVLGSKNGNPANLSLSASLGNITFPTSEPCPSPTYDPFILSNSQATVTAQSFAQFTVNFDPTNYFYTGTGSGGKCTEQLSASGEGDYSAVLIINYSGFYNGQVASGTINIPITGKGISTTNILDSKITKYSINLYPNPASNVLNLPFENGKISFINTTGAVSLSKEITEKTFDIGLLESGLYTVIVENGGKQYIDRIFKK